MPPDLTRPQGLIVSVQAPEGSPLRAPGVIAAMAEAALRNGASGVRLESPEHIGAVRRRCPDALIIGLWKRTLPGSSVYITPGWEHISAVWAAGASVIALDATDRYRPAGEDLAALVQRARSEDTAAHRPPGWDLLPALRRELPAGASLICEGGIASAEQARRALELGADAVVVGTAITGIDLQVAAYCQALG